MVLTARTQQEFSQSEERRLDGALEGFFLVRATFRILFTLAAVLPFSARHWLWSPLADLGDSWRIVASALLVCALALVASAQLTFEPRWRLALLPALLLALVPIGLDSDPRSGLLEGVLMVAVIFGLSFAFARRDLWNLWRRRPEYALKRIVLPAGGPTDSQEDDEDAVRAARKRMWRSSLVGIGGCTAFTLLTAWFTYKPGLWQEFEQLESAWNSGDRAGLLAVAAYPESFERALDELQAENGWNRLPAIGFHVEQDRSPVRRLLIPGDRQLPVWRIEVWLAERWWPFDWIHHEGRWRLLAIEGPGEASPGERRDRVPILSTQLPR